MTRRTMMGRREHEAYPDRINGLGNLLGRERNIYTSCLEKIRTAGFSGRSAISVLGHHCARGACHQGGGG